MPVTLEELRRQAICRHGRGHGHGTTVYGLGAGRYCDECGLIWSSDQSPRRVAVDALIKFLQTSGSNQVHNLTNTDEVS